MKYVLISADYFPSTGGVAHYYHNLTSNFPGGLEVISDLSKIFSSSGPFKWRKSIPTILSSVKKGDKLVVGQILPLGTAAFIASLFCPFDYYLVFHGMDFSLAIRNWRKRLLTKMIIKRSSGIICANSQTAKELQAFFSKKQCIVVNPGLNQERPLINPEMVDNIKRNYGLDNQILLLSLGRLVKRKGIDTVILALAEIKKTHPEIFQKLAYVVCGEGKDRQYLEDLAIKSGIDVIFTGQISEEEKWAWLAASDIFLMPSRKIGGDYEGFGIVFLEAQSLGKAVIGAKSGGIADAIDDGQTGLLCEPDDPLDLTEQILKLLTDPELRDKIGKQGAIAVAEKFSWDKLAIAFKDFIDQNK